MAKDKKTKADKADKPSKANTVAETVPVTKPEAEAGPSAPALGSALIKSLKSPSDPPTPGGPSKIAIASGAWADTALLVPRKADVLRDWIVEAWSRAKAG
jgi:hypothetical protein